MDLRIETLGPGELTLVKGPPGARLMALPPEQIRSLFKRSGALWLRGFQVGAPDFLSFIRQFLRELITLNSPERRRHFAVKEIQSVTGGQEALSLHPEMGHLPGRPELLSFWCEVPAKDGGQTVAVDGIALFKALSPTAQQLVLEKKVLFVSRVPKERWVDRLGGQEPERVAAAYAHFPEARWTLESDGTLVVHWPTLLAFKPRFSDELALCSNIFPYVVPGVSAQLEDGAPFPPELVAELAQTSERLSAQIEWQAGDVLMLDNTRWLHGRRAVRGLGRRMQMLQGYLSDAWLED